MSTEKTPDAGSTQDGSDKPDLDTGMDTVGVEATPAPAAAPGKQAPRDLT